MSRRKPSERDELALALREVATLLACLVQEVNRPGVVIHQTVQGPLDQTVEGPVGQLVVGDIAHNRVGLSRAREPALQLKR